MGIFEEWESQSTEGSGDHNYLYSILYRISSYLIGLNTTRNKPKIYKKMKEAHLHIINKNEAQITIK